MNDRNIFEMIKKYNTISIIGMDKNVGKTTVLNYILSKARGKVRLGLTSIGRDGEEEDSVTETEKPRIYVEKGTYIATSKQCLYNSDITKEIIRTTGINTAMGEVIIAGALSDGYVELGGPSLNSYMRDICKMLKDIGSEIVIVDGALSRKSFASPAITEATILSTGGALSRNMDKVVEQTSHCIRLLSLEKENNEKVQSLCKNIPITHRVSIINKDMTVINLNLKTSLEASKEIAESLNEHTAYVLIRGIISDKLIEGIMNSTDRYKNITFLCEDGTKLFITSDTLYKFEKQGGKLKVLNSINIICITSNPTSPYGYEFDGDKFLKKLKSKISLPIFDVKAGE
ncbi:hypothetical protein HBE96_09355 [Clostridium sp. P21]|uniref:Uncharacterized protein n=1 Tax=Clostridium muellerianum TaxID=2716538 RepID=A0A7Y0EG86_9CLOT|nr:hypothetical protein [Clostridium muellerianum]NMM62904.1 hypothetical protein [Clostridium muellerianum]